MPITGLIVVTYMLAFGALGFVVGRSRGHPVLGAILGAYTGLLGFAVYVLYERAGRSRGPAPA